MQSLPRERQAGAMHLVESGRLRHLVWRPAAPATQPLPVLCFLHGYDEAAPMPIERALTVHGPLSPHSSSITRDRFLVVAPQLPRAGDIWHRWTDDLIELVSGVAREHGGDAARWLLTGFSFGGNGVFDVALASPGRWRALWSVDPTRVPRGSLGTLPVWLSIGAAARRWTTGFIQALALERASRSPGARTYLDEGLDHVGSAASAYADDRIYAWLLTHAT